MLQLDPPQQTRDGAMVARWNLVPCSIGKHDGKRAKLAFVKSGHDFGDDVRSGLRHAENIAARSRFLKPFRPNLG